MFNISSYGWAGVGAVVAPPGGGIKAAWSRDGVTLTLAVLWQWRRVGSLNLDIDTLMNTLLGEFSMTILNMIKVVSTLT